MLHTVSLGLASFGLWLLLSGHYNTLLISLGVISSVIVVIISMRMDVVDHDGHPLHLGWKALGYLPWLIWKIILSNLDVCRTILHPRLPISPTIVHLKSSQKTELGKVIFVNSITLTPGTVSMQIENNERIEVHALNQAAALELEEGEMDRRVSRMEGKN